MYKVYKTKMPTNHEILSIQNSEQDTENSEYIPNKLEGIDQAASGAAAVLEDAIDGNRKIGVSETDRGLRGIVEAPVPGGSITGLFDGQSLDQITIAINGEDGQEHVVRIDKPESVNPMLFLDDTPATAEDLPSVVAVIEQIKAEREALKQSGEQAKTQPEEERLENENNQNSDKLAT